ncbi:MAG: hypothetical protein M3404_01465 [Actinomycetota bacterium]|nr:hypothetical protein [Actinomycetota bacterium]
MNKHAHETDTIPTGCTNARWRFRRLRVTAGLALLTGAMALPIVGLNTAAAHPAKNDRAASSSHQARCAAALRSVQAAGLALPAGFEYRCPGDTRSFVGDRQRWGVTCYHHPRFCPGRAYVAVNPARVGASDARLRYVVAHEIGHAIDYMAQGSTTEQSAHARARAAGF